MGYVREDLIYVDHIGLVSWHYISSPLRFWYEFLTACECAGGCGCARGGERAGAIVSALGERERLRVRSVTSLQRCLLRRCACDSCMSMVEGTACTRDMYAPCLHSDRTGGRFDLVTSIPFSFLDLYIYQVL